MKPPLSAQGSGMEPPPSFPPARPPTLTPASNHPQLCVCVFIHMGVCAATRPRPFVCACAPGFRRRGADLRPLAHSHFCGLSVTATAATSSRCGESFSAAVAKTKGLHRSAVLDLLKPLATQNPQILILRCHSGALRPRHTGGRRNG